MAENPCVVGFLSSAKEAMEGGVWEWLLEKQKPVTISPYTSDNHIKESVEVFLRSFEPRKGECFATAAHVSLCIPGCNYVEGYVSYMGIPITHAWNEYNGIHFDLTNEIVFEGDAGFSEYTEIINLNPEKVIDFSEKCHYIGEWMFYMYRELVLA